MPGTAAVKKEIPLDRANDQGRYIVYGHKICGCGIQM